MKFKFNRFSLFIPTFLFVVIIDQLSKWWARGQGSVIYNQGISYGYGSQGSVLFFAVLTLIILFFLFYALKDIWKKNLGVFGLFSGAALSNVLDRFWWGGVQDFIRVPVLHLENNLADWVIFGCLAWAGWQMLSARRRN